MKQLKTYELFSFLKKRPKNPYLEKIKELDLEIKSHFKNVKTSTIPIASFITSDEDSRMIWNFNHLGEDVEISCWVENEKLNTLYTVVGGSSLQSLMQPKGLGPHSSVINQVNNVIELDRCNKEINLKVAELAEEITKEDIEFAFNEIEDLECVSDFRVYHSSRTGNGGYNSIYPVIFVRFKVNRRLIDPEFNYLLDGIVSQVESVYNITAQVDERENNYSIVLKKK